RQARGAARRRAAAAHGEGVRAAVVPRVEPEPRVLPRPAHAPGVGVLLRTRHRHGDRAHAPAAREGRARSVESAASRDGLGRRLPVVRMRRLPPLRIQLAVLVLAAVCLPLVVVLSSGWVMLGMHDNGKIVAVAAGSALAGLAGALLLARRILRPLEQLRAASA